MGFGWVWWWPNKEHTQLTGAEYKLKANQLDQRACQQATNLVAYLLLVAILLKCVLTGFFSAN